MFRSVQFLCIFFFFFIFRFHLYRMLIETDHAKSEIMGGRWRVPAGVPCPSIQVHQRAGSFFKIFILPSISVLHAIEYPFERNYVF